MLTKIGRKRFLEKYPNFPTASDQRNIFHFPNTYSNYVLYVEHKLNTGLANNLSSATTSLIAALGIKTLYFLGDTKTPWIYQDNNYKPIAQGVEYFKQNKLAGNFIGAIQTPTAQLPEFIKHLYWLTKGNSIVNYVHFSDPNFNFIGSICQYGNLHFYPLNRKTDNSFNEALSSSGFLISDDGKCGGEKITKRKLTNQTP